MRANAAPARAIRVAVLCGYLSRRLRNGFEPGCSGCIRVSKPPSRTKRATLTITRDEPFWEGDSMSEVRSETDSLGVVEVPGNAVRRLRYSPRPWRTRPLILELLANCSAPPKSHAQSPKRLGSRARFPPRPRRTTRETISTRSSSSLRPGHYLQCRWRMLCAGDQGGRGLVGNHACHPLLFLPKRQVQRGEQHHVNSHAAGRPDQGQVHLRIRQPELSQWRLG
jgi:hypothetical protein